MDHINFWSLLMALIYRAKPQALLDARKEKTASPECRANHCMIRATRSPEKVANFSYWGTIEAAS
jgi:hypothetical protein